MKSARLYSALVIAAAAALSACQVQRTSTVAPTGPSSIETSTPAPSSGSSSTQSLVGTWSTTSSASPSASAPTCTNFTWTITSQTETDVAGNFTALCLGNATVAGGGTGHITGSTVEIVISGNAQMPGTPVCLFNLSGTGAIGGDQIRVPYSGTTCLGPVSGTQTLSRAMVQPSPPSSPEPAPAPAPTPTPAPEPAPPSNSGDVLQGAVIHNSPLDMGGWPITTRITAVEIRSSGVHLEFSKLSGPGRWPDMFPAGWDEPLQWTMGMCMNLSGRWNCSAPIQFWYGLYESGGPPSGYASNWFYDPGRWGPMSSHQPAVGETIGFFACAGNCRNTTTSNGSVHERSDVVLVPMPGNGGASYRF